MFYVATYTLRISKSASHVNLDLLIVDPLLKQIFVFDTLFEGLSALALGPMATLGFVPVLLLTLRAAVAVRLASLAELPRRPIERQTARRACLPEVEKSTTYINHGSHKSDAQTSCIGSSSTGNCIKES